MQRNANMLKILKKVRFCRFYGFLCKNAVPSLSPEYTFVLRRDFIRYWILINYLFIVCILLFAWANKRSASGSDFSVLNGYYSDCNWTKSGFYNPYTPQLFRVILGYFLFVFGIKTSEFSPSACVIIQFLCMFASE